MINWNRSAFGFRSSNEAVNQAVADFVAYLIENNDRWVMTMNAYSPYYAVQQNAEYQEFVSGDLALTALGQQQVNGIVPPAFTGSSELREELKAMITGVLNDGWTATSAVNTAAKNSEAAMNE